MGIPSFGKFISQQRLLQPHSLQGSKLVVDGKNVIHFITDHRGDCPYKCIYERTTEFVAKLRACNIEPFFVFDGSDEPDDRKLRHNLKKMAKCVSDLESGRLTSTPLLMYTTTKKALTDAGVRHVACSFEADAQIVDLANEFLCPVLSGDNDFYVFDIKQGFIPYFSLKYALSEPIDSIRANGYLKVKIFYNSSLLNRFNIKDTLLLGLLPTLCGSDYIDSKQFWSFIRSLKPPFGNHQGTEEIARVMRWLGQLKTVEQGVKQIIRSFEVAKEQHRVEIELKTAISAFWNDGTGSASHFSIKEYFMKEPHPENKCVVYQSRYTTETIKKAQDTETGYYVVEKVRLGCLQEDINKESVFLASSFIRQVQCGMFLPPELANEEHRRRSKPVILEFLKRAKGSPVTDLERSYNIPGFDEEEISQRLKINVTEPVQEIKDFGAVPHITDIQGLSDDKRLSLFCAILGMKLDDLKSAPRCFEDSRIVLASMTYWKLHTREDDQVKQSLVRSVIASCFIIQGKMNVKTNKQTSATPEQTTQAMHVIMEYQTCLREGVGLNEMLRCPLPMPNPAAIVDVHLQCMIFTELYFQGGTVEKFVTKGSPEWKNFEIITTVLE